MALTMPTKRKSGTARLPGKVRIEKLEGVLPTRQARSGATFLALVKAGREALKSGTLEDMTIGDLAKTAGASVGAFYGRFENKEAFFNVILQLTTGEIWEALRSLTVDLERRRASTEECLATFAHFWVATFRTHRSLYIAAIKHVSSVPGAWTPFTQLGWASAELAFKTLQPRLRAEEAIDDERQVRIAFQFINGLLVNATINDPGPVHLDDSEMENQVLHFLRSFLGIGRATSGSGTKPSGRTRS